MMYQHTKHIRNFINNGKLQALVYDILPPRRKVPESDTRSVKQWFSRQIMYIHRRKVNILGELEPTLAFRRHLRLIVYQSDIQQYTNNTMHTVCGTRSSLVHVMPRKAHEEKFDLGVERY